jgi:uncharacterized membrane protein YgcG
MNAKGMSVLPPSTEVVLRNRVKLLEHAAGMREAKASLSSQSIWLASLRRIAVTLAVIAILFASGTGLVRAASTTLPGDNLYPVKRTWEDVLLLFTFNLQQRETLEIQHENERLDELNELFAKGLSAKVDFAGTVALQHGLQWRVAGIPVVISAQTEMPDQPVVVGTAVRVIGVTGADGIVQAERVKLLPAGAKLPDVKDEPEIEQENNEGPNQQTEDNSGPGSEGEMPEVELTQTPGVEVDHGGSNSGSGSDSNSNDNTGNDNNSTDDNSNDSSGSNSNDNINHNENSGGDNSNDGGNSGSGGGDNSNDGGGNSGSGGSGD